MGKRLVFLALISLISLVSCEPVKTDVLPSKTTSTTENTSNILLPANPQTATLPPADIEKKMESVVWLSPGKVYVDNLFPGAQAEWNLRIHNGHEFPSEFLIYVRPPDNPYATYSIFPAKNYDWISISEKKTILKPKETKEILIILKMPKNDSSFGKKYEFWIGVMDNSQQGMVRTEICSRWMISIKER